jgi:hypothetical protein
MLKQAEGLEVLTASTFYFWWKDKGGHARKHLYNNPTLNQVSFYILCYGMLCIVILYLVCCIQCMHA